MASMWLALATACTDGSVESSSALQASTVTSDDTADNTAEGSSDDAESSTTANPAAEDTGRRPLDGAAPRPAWLGTRVLPTVPGGAVVTPQTTPEELRDRRLVTPDRLPPPADDRFQSTLGPVPDDVLARSTWVAGCPVAAEDLNYLTLSFWGFDGKPHTGEMIVNAEVAADVLSVFARLYEARFPIEEMYVVDQAALNAEPTGDGNNTTSFVCRPVTGGTSFSQHAYGLAIDINPFHNPYRNDDLILPELAVDYLDRDSGKVGVIVDGDVAVQAFSDIGWSWGGEWSSLKDYQHFSSNNR